MSVTKLKSPGTTDVMKNEEGNDSLDTIIRQAIGKEPFLSFSRAGDSPVQWIQLLHALDQQELPGWPLLSPLKVQMQKCDKCPREFFSPINYRRHIRVHHRLKKLDKDSTKNRELLAAFWDKLSVDESKDIISFKSISLEEVPGSAVIKNLTTLIRKPGFSSLPHVYLRAGSALLDIVQGRPSKFPLTSQELFTILDDASEKTFLCGPAVSIQKYVFDGEATKIGLETKNLVACLSFLVEQKLVKAWLADKDAEALRFQKLLVEEEEAAQKRQAELLERKRQKKLRQKEQKVKEQRQEGKIWEEGIDEMLEDMQPAEPSSPSAESPSETPISDPQQDHYPQSFETFQPIHAVEIEDSELHSGFDSGYADQGTVQYVERNAHGSSRRHVVSRWHSLPKSRRGLANGFHTDQNSQAPKMGAVQKPGSNRQSRAAPVTNGNKVWSRKSKPENDGDCLDARVQKEAMAMAQTDQMKNHEVLIGSISVALGTSQDGSDLAGGRDDCLAEHHNSKKSSFQEKAIKPDAVHTGANRGTVKLWRPVSRNGHRDPLPAQSCIEESEVGVISEERNDQTSPNESNQRSSFMDSDSENNPDNSFLEFSSHAAKAFLAQRWKEAIAAEHVKLVLSPDLEPNDCKTTMSQPLDTNKRNVLGNAERLVNMGQLDSPATGAAKAKLRTKPEKVVKIKYIPKQRAVT